MNLPGEIILVYGSTHRTGTTMYARSLAQDLAIALDESMLFLSVSGRGREISPEQFRELCLEEAGVEYLNYRGYYENFDAIREKYSYCVMDGGTAPNEALFRTADHRILVTDQFESSFRLTEQVLSIQREDEKTSPEDTLIVVNRTVPGDPHDLRYIRSLFSGYSLILIPESHRGREADWEGLTLYELGVRSYEKAVREGTEWIRRNKNE